MNRRTRQNPSVTVKDIIPTLGASAAAARAAVGASAVGDAVFTAADEAAARGAIGALGLVQADARFQGILPAGYYTPVGKSNGAIGSLDSGQAVSSFGNSPGAVVSGQIVHTPTAGSQTASYYQVNAGARVRRFGCEVMWPSGSTGALALVLPTGPWSSSGGVLSATTAGLHFVDYGNGIWHCSQFNVPAATETTYADYTTNGRHADMRDGAFHSIEVWIDPDTGTATVFFPDGSSTTFQSDYIKNNTAQYAIWEQYEFNGTSDTPCVIRNLWLDTQARRSDSFVATKADVAAIVPAHLNIWDYLGTATAAGTTTLTANSAAVQSFTGTTTQDVVLPGSVPRPGAMWLINNGSTGVVTVKTSDGSTLGGLATGNMMICIAISNTPTGTGNWLDSGIIVATVNSTQTLTNKRVDPRVTSTASASTLSPNWSTADEYVYTALAANLTINAPSGTINGARMRFRIKDNGTTRTLTWNAAFRAIGVTIPTATTAGKWLYVEAEYNAADTKWDVIDVKQEA